MSVSEFIRENVLRPRLLQAGALVVYDADRRYRELCFALVADNVQVVDASESSTESREASLLALREIAQPTKSGGAPLEAVLIYVPARPPETDEQRQADPFALYIECGAVFPQDDGDEYLSLCLRAKPDHATEIRRVFDSSPTGPAFAVVDAIGGSVSWPQLRSLLRAESAREILKALLAPSSHQLDALKQSEGWSHEARDFLLATVGLTLKTRSKAWSAITDELWRYVLFSEFAFDFRDALPEALLGVPRAPSEAQAVIEDVCSNLRSDPLVRATYVERAESIEAELNLAEHIVGMEDLGERDTFPFEERSFLSSAIRGILCGDIDSTRRVLNARKNSVWVGSGESRAQWQLVQAGMSLVERCNDLERQFPEHVRSQSSLIDFYLTNFREVDRLQREFEQAAGDLLDPFGLMHDVAEHARGRYRRLVEVVQTAFVRHLETSGWPPDGRPSNGDTFDRFVAGTLKATGHKVAYLMIDALRYELGVALHMLLADDGPVELEATYAQLPTITPVGMASLLPGASTELTLSVENGSLIPKLDGSPVANVQQRMNVLAKRYGDRFAEMQLGEFVRGKASVEGTVDLLVLRSTEIDSQLETNPETTLGLIPGTLSLIRAALHKLRGMGFTEAVIATDHGFYLNAHPGAGDVGAKPQGNWLVNAHDRLLLGDGQEDSNNLVISAAKLGVRGEFNQVAIPRAMVPYKAGHLYYHGGASLAEAVVPVLVAHLGTESHEERASVQLQLNYKNGSKRITTLLPVIEITLSVDMFSQAKTIEILLEAQDSKGNVVGEPRPGAGVNPASGTVTLKPGSATQVALRMAEEFRGKFKVVALNPQTLAAYSTLALETDYTE